MQAAHVQNAVLDLVRKARADLVGCDLERHRQQQGGVGRRQRRALALARQDGDGGFVGFGVQRQFAEQRVVGAVDAKDLAQQVDHVAGQRQQVAVQIQVCQQVQKFGLSGDEFRRHRLAGGGEQQVLGDGQGGVISVFAEQIGVARQIGLFQCCGHVGAQIDQTLRQIGVGCSVDALFGGAAEQGGAAAHAAHQRQPPVQQRIVIRGTGTAMVQPRRIQHVVAVAGPQRLGGKGCVLA